MSDLCRCADEVRCDMRNEIERLTTDRDEWERLWKKASVAVIDLQDEVEKLKEDRLDFRERIAELESLLKGDDL